MDFQELFFKLTRLHRTLIIAAVCVLLLIGFYFLFISDMREEISRIEAAIGKIKMEIHNEEKTLREGPKLKARIQDLKQSLQTMVASLPEKQDIEALLKRITDLLSETNLVVTKFIPGQEQINTELYYATIPIDLNVRGDYFKQGSFFTGLNDLPRIVNVPTIKLSPAGGGAGREAEVAKKLEVMNLTADISGVTYRRLTPEEIKSIAAAATRARRR